MSKRTKEGPRPVDVMVGGRIRSQRIMRGMSQTELANKCGITFQQIQKYEKGTNRISASRLVQIAQILGVTVSFLFGEDGGRMKKVDNPDIEMIKRGDTLRALRAFDRLPDGPTRRALLHLITTMAGDAT